METQKRIVTRKFGWVQPKGSGINVDIKSTSVSGMIVDEIGGFIVMIETCQKGNTRFNINNVCETWHKNAYKESTKYFDANAFDILKITAKLLANAHKKHNIAMPRKMAEIYTATQSKTYRSMSKSQILDMGKTLQSYITHAPIHQTKGE